MINCYEITKNQNCYFFDFFWKRNQWIYFVNIWKKNSLIYTSLYLNSTNLLRMFFTFRRIISNLSSAFREIIGDVFTPPPTNTHTHTHFNFDLLWRWCSSTSEYVLFILVAFIKHMQDKKSSSLVDISNFNKTKSLSGNQALNKNSINGKKQKAASIQFRTEKNFFWDVWP